VNYFFVFILSWKIATKTKCPQSFETAGLFSRETY